MLVKKMKQQIANVFDYWMNKFSVAYQYEVFCILFQRLKFEILNVVTPMTAYFDRKQILSLPF